MLHKTMESPAVAAAPPVTLEGAVEAFMRAAGMPEDEHTADTPRRVAKAWRHRLAGYEADPRAHLERVFPVSGSPGIVIVSGIQFASTCAHHLLPITGVATVAYRPDEQDGLVVGLSKLSRLFDGYARRLQVQEQLGSQTVDSLVEVLRPVGAAAVISAEHGCMTMRGVQQPGALTTTVATGGQWCAGHPDMEWVLGEHWRSPRLAK